MIYVECYPDDALVRSLTGLPRRQVRHEFKGKGEICNRLRKVTDCTGLVDEDPSSGQPRYMGEATVAEDLPHEGLRVLRHQATRNRVVVLCPRLEEWILGAAREVGLDVRDHGLPNDARSLHGVINLNLDKFNALLAALKGSSKRLRTLQRLLEKEG